MIKKIRISKSETRHKAQMLKDQDKQIRLLNADTRVLVI
jgi:hypothetical protein